MSSHPGTAAILRCLAPLFAVQFLTWAAMFLLWIGAYPLVVLGVLGGAGGGVAPRAGVLAVAGCFALYATLAAALAFAIPRAETRLPAPVLLALAAWVGAGGLALLAGAQTLVPLLGGFALLAVGWCALSNLPYGIAARLAGEAGLDHALRLFAFSTVLPQLAVVALLGWRLGDLDAATARAMLRGAAALMAAGGTLALVLRRRL